MHELSSGRRWRLPAGSGKIAMALGACLCAGQLLVASSVPAGSAAGLPAVAGRAPATSGSALSGRALELATADREPAAASRRSSRPVRQPAVRSRSDAGRTPAARPARGGTPTGATLAGPVAVRVIAEAARLSGRPYRFGAAGPSAFDCSGFTQYVFGRFGISLPHKANSQQRYGRAVNRSQAGPGDLIFFRNGSYAYHVGIYAGGGYMYDAPRPGRTVGKHRIWSGDYTVRRLIG
ncbi:MAG TPA: NlpC/P60 family protein [Pilimelia sp.]|nr:NlpC/P60 family protein [Pilimelia sp.]